MTLPFALAISIGVLAVVATWLFLGPLAALNMQIWQAFVAWACFFHSGGKVDGLLEPLAPMAAIVPTIGSIIVGALFGWLSEMVAGKMIKKT